jgi:YidC/Oxa1 family membrane protein insertase
MMLASLLTNGSTTVTTVAKAASKSSGSILDPIAKPIAWVLAEIYSVIPNYGVAILVLSVLWMALISPLTLKSTRSMLAMQKLQPLLKKLQEQHKNDKQAFAQAQMELFREHGVSPFGACLPMLLPMPVFFALFRVIDGLSHTVKGPDPNIHCVTATCYDPKYLSSSSRMWDDIVHAGGHINAFGMNLSQTALSHHSSFMAALPFWILLLIMGGTSYWQSSMMMSRNQANQTNPQMQTQMRMMKFLPLVFVLFCIRFPAGVILYYAMSNVCRIAQQDAMYRFDPKVKALVAQEVREVEAKTYEIDEREAEGGSSRPAGGSKGSKGPKGPSGSGPGGPGAPKGSSGSGSAKSAASNGAGSSDSKPVESKSRSSAPASGGRGWFRELLAAAEQEQKNRGSAKVPPGTKGSGRGASNGGKPGRPGSNGRTSGPRASGGSRGSGSSGGGTSNGSSGRKTNRKRRGR